MAAVHAGWKGTVKHIVSNVMDHLNKMFGTQGEDVIACIGPSISLESFEVGDEVYDAFEESGFRYVSYFYEEEGDRQISY
mgnify:CR=1 FL=1